MEEEVLECTITVAVINLQRRYMRSFCVFRIAVLNAIGKIKKV